jgi:hypothetical protein
VIDRIWRTRIDDRAVGGIAGARVRDGRGVFLRRRVGERGVFLRRRVFPGRGVFDRIPVVAAATAVVTVWRAALHGAPPTASSFGEDGQERERHPGGREPTHRG